MRRRSTTTATGSRPQPASRRMGGLREQPRAGTGRDVVAERVEHDLAVVPHPAGPLPTVRGCVDLECDPVEPVREHDPLEKPAAQVDPDPAAIRVDDLVAAHFSPGKLVPDKCRAEVLTRLVAMGAQPEVQQVEERQASWRRRVPVDHCSQPVPRDQQIAGPEIAVAEPAGEALELCVEPLTELEDRLAMLGLGTGSCDDLCALDERGAGFAGLDGVERDQEVDAVVQKLRGELVRGRRARKTLLCAPVTETELAGRNQSRNALPYYGGQGSGGEALERNAVSLDLVPPGPDRNPEHARVRERDGAPLARKGRPVLDCAADPAAYLLGDCIQHRRLRISAPADDERALGQELRRPTPAGRAAAGQVDELIDVPEHDVAVPVPESRQAPACAAGGDPRLDRPPKPPGCAHDQAAALVVPRLDRDDCDSTISDEALRVRDLDVGTLANELAARVDQDVSEHGVRGAKRPSFGRDQSRKPTEVAQPHDSISRNLRHERTLATSRDDLLGRCISDSISTSTMRLRSHDGDFLDHPLR